MTHRMQKTAAIAVLLLSASALSTNALADDTNAELLKQMKAMQKQIQALQSQLDKMKTVQAATEAKAQQAQETSAKAAAALEPSAGGRQASSGTGKGDLFDNGKVKVTLGGFAEASGIYRRRSETADINSSFNTGIPYPYQAGYHMGEFRASTRNSRFSVLAEGNVNDSTKLASFMEIDFIGAANTANSNESNSYNPRLRQFYGTVDWNNSGWHMLAGQAWSLLTMGTQGITPRKENIPLTIDAQYVPGFTWTRNTQFRVVKDLDKGIWAGLSVESPQALVNAGPNVPTTCTNSSCFLTAGGSGFTSATLYSTDIAPDLIAKLAFEPGYGHYEIYGLERTFYDRSNGSNNTTYGGGVGAGAIMPIIEKHLDFQLSGLYGNGVGRYGSVQLPDVTVKPDGSLATITGLELLAGLIGHPDEDWDVYGYAGEERVSKQAYGTANGYGNLNYDNSQCKLPTGTAAHCVANTSSVWQLTAGAWWKFYHGSYGTMKAGLQDSYTERNIFGGTGGGPSTNDNITMVSFRYYPF